MSTLREVAGGCGFCGYCHVIPAVRKRCAGSRWSSLIEDAKQRSASITADTKQRENGIVISHIIRYRKNRLII